MADRKEDARIVAFQLSYTGIGLVIRYRPGPIGFSLSTVGNPSEIPSEYSGIVASSARCSGGAHVAPSFFSSAGAD